MDVELNGETDDEDMEDGEVGFDDGSVQVRNIRDPGQPVCQGTPGAHDHASTVQTMVQILCDGTRGERIRTEDQTRKMTWKGYRMCQWTMGFLERGNRKSTCLLFWSSANGDT